MYRLICTCSKTIFSEDPSLACKVTVKGLTKITCVLCSPADIPVDISPKGKCHSSNIPHVPYCLLVQRYMTYTKIVRWA